MSEHETTYREEIRTTLPKPTRISWGALFAGLFAVLATSWLFYVLGGAIGVSVADTADSTLINSGLTEGVIVWMLLSALVAYFVGGATASRLAGATEDVVGMLHGFVLWSVATVVMLLLGYCGVSSFLQTGQSLASASVAAASTTAGAAERTVASGARGLSSAAAALPEVELSESLRDELTSRVAEAIAAVDAEGDPEVPAETIRASIESLDTATLEDLTQRLIDDDQQSAAELIASETDLTAAQANELIEGAYEALEERLGNPDNEAGLATDLKRQLTSQAAALIAELDPEVSAEAIEEALDDLDRETMSEAATALARGDFERAKDLLTENTDLEDAQIEELVSAVTKTYQEQIDRVGETLNETAEAASDYAQAVLWTSFTATGLGLAVSVLGGWCGADTTRRLYYESRQAENG